jgi:flavin reductase (DIM6/NTAB) family NADH-FMN oxidoreductase RutF
VTIITTLAPDRTPIGVTANSFTSVSLDPPLVLFNLARRAFSAGLFEGAPSYAVNILSAGQHELANRFARAGSDKWAGVGYSPGTDGCPLLAGALTSIECRPYSCYDGGDHLIFVGEVVRIADGGEDLPLLFYRSAFRALSSSEPVSLASKAI